MAREGAWKVFAWGKPCVLQGMGWLGMLRSLHGPWLLPSWPMPDFCYLWHRLLLCWAVSR